MATIELQDVTKVFSKPPDTDHLPHRVLAFSTRADRAFADRAAAEGEEPARDGPVVALDHVGLTIPDGQTLSVVGPSGCGKTTLLRVVAGLETDFGGRVLYDGQDVADVPPGDRYIGIVFQNYALYPHFEGWGNLSFFFRMHRVPDEETEERIRITSEMMGIGFKELLGRKPGTLSEGEKQRLAVARAIVRKPRLFLFDEPLSNLDAKLRAQTRVEIKRLLQRFQITAIYVTHNQVEAVSLGDQVAVMRDGRIEQVGTYRELLENPVNAFVAGFLGRPAMNLLTGGRVRAGGVKLGDIIVPLPDAVRPQVRFGQALTLGVRAEAARLTLGGQPSPDGVRLHGTVEVVEPDFAHRTQLVYARSGGLTYAAGAPLEVLLNVGDQVEVVFPVGQLYFFDDETGRRVG